MFNFKPVCDFTDSQLPLSFLLKWTITLISIFSLGEGCTHIAGLLFKLEACAQEKENTACTSKPCNWNKGGKRKKDPQEVLNISFKKLKYGGNEPCANEKKNKFTVKNSITDQGQNFLSLLTAKLGNLNYSPVIFD